MLKPTLEPTRSRPFEGVDVRAAGAKGGHASGVSRRLKKQRQLEAKILESRNGMAAMKLLEQKRRDEAELRARQLAADRMVSELDQEADDLRATIEDLQGECDTLRAEHAALEQRKQAAASIDTSIDDTTLVELLRALGEERVARACDELGWIEDVDAVA